METPYKDMQKTFKSYLTPIGSKLVNKPGEPIFKVALFETKGGDGTVCLVCDMHHTIADGNTYYAIYNMLSPSSDIVALNPQRKVCAETVAVPPFHAETVTLPPPNTPCRWGAG